MKNGFVKVACAAPRVQVADPVRNTEELIRLTTEADAANASLILFPALCITGATCGDLFRNAHLIHAAAASLECYLNATRDTNIISVVGLPLQINNRLYHCTVFCQSGRILKVTPKQNLRADEHRCFTPFHPDCFGESEIKLFGQMIPLDVSLSVTLSDGQCTVICDPSDAPQLVGEVERKRVELLTYTKQNGGCRLYATVGNGESTTDFVYGGYRLICADGQIVAEALPFDFENEILYAEIDTAGCSRAKPISVPECPPESEYFTHTLCDIPSKLPVDPHPFFPADPDALERHCKEILQIQAHGLKTRMERAFVQKAIIGISGGLDSTLALLVAVEAMKLAKRPSSDILAITMPCFGTTNRTKSNATVLCEELGVDFRCIPIGDSVNLHFRDICHDPSVHDVTYENCQARERTQVLMDIANGCGGMVIGTGDLSELALGWATYNGDHMSMYGVNADIPKTLIRHVVAYYANEAEKNGQAPLAAVLRDILDTPVSPELLPSNEKGEIAQKTEDLVGPYELHDFYLYHLLRHGLSPEHLFRLAKQALGSTYDDETLLKWLEIFLRRFFNQQFKRSCLPDGPAVCEIGLSPRGAWRMPSDASSAIWLEEVQALKRNFLQ